MSNPKPDDPASYDGFRVMLDKILLARRHEATQNKAKKLSQAKGYRIEADIWQDALLVLIKEHYALAGDTHIAVEFGTDGPPPDVKVHHVCQLVSQIEGMEMSPVASYRSREFVLGEIERIVKESP